MQMNGAKQERRKNVFCVIATTLKEKRALVAHWMSRKNEMRQIFSNKKLIVALKVLLVAPRGVTEGMPD